MSPYDRLVARLSAGRLDRELAEGASPGASAQLNLRASALTAPTKRRELAATLRRIARDEVEPAAFGARLAASREQTSKARLALEQLARRLADAAPVDPRGVALTQELLSDGAGPLFWDRSRDDLGALLGEALAALGPGAVAEAR
jgi:hypothetical protein